MIREMAGGLARLGDFGLVVPLLVVALGWICPPLASFGPALLAPSVILMFTMSVAIVEPGRLCWREAWPVIGLAVCNLLLSPLLAYGLVGWAGLGQLGGWVVLVAACPAAGAATLVAGLLGLAMRPMLLAQLVCFFALPITAPLVTALLFDAIVIDPWILFGRITAMVALPCILALLLRGTFGRAMPIRPLRGLGTVGLCGIALALAHGLTAKINGDINADIPWAACIESLALASLAGGSLGFATGVISGRFGGARLGAAFALSGALRNVSLLWSATAGLGTPDAEAVMILGTLWTFVLPALLALCRWPLARLERTMIANQGMSAKPNL